MISGPELREFRLASGLTGGQMAEILNTATGMRYTQSSISKWEKEYAVIPSYVQEALEGLMASAPSASTNGADPSSHDDSPVSPDAQPTPPASVRRPDTVPPPPKGMELARPISLESTCAEMFRGIGQMVELFAVTTGQPKVLNVGTENGQPVLISLLEADGRIIIQDSDDLGRAWAKLAAQNAWVGRIIGSLTTGGAWVEVIAATSGTMVKVFRTHVEYNQWSRQQRSVPEQRDPDQPEE